MDIKSCILDRVSAVAMVKSPEDFNMRGPVRLVTEWGRNGTDTVSVMEFNANGQIISEWYPKEKLRKKYDYDRGKLKLVKCSFGEWQQSEVMTYNEQGYLIESETTSREVHWKEKYGYNADLTEIKVSFRYLTDISQRDVVLQERFVLSYNDRGKIKGVRHVSVHTENTYGSRQTFSYEPTSGYLTEVWLVDDCALTVGCNSCLNLHLIITRDKCGQIVSETLSDYTVRNATWSYGYVKRFKRNERNDIVQTEEIMTGMQVDVLLQKSAFSGFETYPYTHYLYDSQGNWNQKINFVSTNVAFPIGYREIQYWK